MPFVSGGGVTWEEGRGSRRRVGGDGFPGLVLVPAGLTWVWDQWNGNGHLWILTSNDRSFLSHVLTDKEWVWSCWKWVWLIPTL